MVVTALPLRGHWESLSKKKWDVTFPKNKFVQANVKTMMQSQLYAMKSGNKVSQIEQPTSITKGLNLAIPSIFPNGSSLHVAVVVL